MADKITRNLVAAYPDGRKVPFEITVSLPERRGDEFSSIIDSGGILFDSEIRSFGFDGIDAITYALHTLDVFIFEKENLFVVQWPDGTGYNRSKIDNYRWS